MELQEKVILTLNAGLACALFVLMLVYALTEPFLFVLIILFFMCFMVACSAEYENPKKLDRGVVDLRISVLVLVGNLVFFAFFFIAVLFVDDPEFVVTQILLVFGGMWGSTSFIELGRISARLRG